MKSSFCSRTFQINVLSLCLFGFLEDGALLNVCKTHLLFSVRSFGSNSGFSATKLLRPMIRCKMAASSFYQYQVAYSVTKGKALTVVFTL